MYRDRRLYGLAFLIGLLSFGMACSAVTLVNIIVVERLHSRGLAWVWGGFVGALAGTEFNYVATARVTWCGGREG